MDYQWLMLSNFFSLAQGGKKLCNNTHNKIKQMYLKFRLGNDAWGEK